MATCLCDEMNLEEQYPKNAMVTMKWHKYSLISPRASWNQWTFCLSGLVRTLSPTSQSWWAAAHTYWTGNIKKSISSQNSYECIKGFFFFFFSLLATFDHLCLLFLWERHIKQSLLRGSFSLLNHRLFFPQDITCYFRVRFQNVLNGLARNWFCIKGKN